MLSFQNFSKKSKKKDAKQPTLGLADWIKLVNDDESVCKLAAERGTSIVNQLAAALRNNGCIASQAETNLILSIFSMIERVAPTLCKDCCVDTIRVLYEAIKGTPKTLVVIMTNASPYHSLSLEKEIALDEVQQASLRCTTTLLIKLGTLYTDTRLIKVHITLLGRILERVPGQEVASPQLRRVAADCLRSMEVAWPTLLLANAKTLTDLVHSEACPSVTTSVLMLAMTVLSNGCAAYLRKQKLSTISRGSLLSVNGGGGSGISSSSKLTTGPLRKENTNNNNNSTSNIVENDDSWAPVLQGHDSINSQVAADSDLAPLFSCSASSSQFGSASQPTLGKGVLATVVEQQEQQEGKTAADSSSSSVAVVDGSGTDGHANMKYNNNNNNNNNNSNKSHSNDDEDDDDEGINDRVGNTSPRAVMLSERYRAAASYQETTTTTITSNVSDLGRISEVSNSTATMTAAAAAAAAAAAKQQQQQLQQYTLMKGGGSFSDTASHSSSYNSLMMTTGTLPLLHEKPGGFRYFRVPTHASQGSLTVVVSPAEVQEVQRLTLSFMETLPRLPSAAVHDARQLLLPLLSMSTPKPRKLRSILEKMLATGSPQLVHIVLDISDLEHLLNDDSCVNSDDDGEEEEGESEEKQQHKEEEKDGAIANNKEGDGDTTAVKNIPFSSASASSLVLNTQWHVCLSDRLVQILNSPLIPVESRTVVLTWLLKEHAQYVHDQSSATSSFKTKEKRSNSSQDGQEEEEQEEEEEEGQKQGTRCRHHHHHHHHRESPLLSRWRDLLPKTRDTGRIVTLKVKALSACLACGVGNVWEICQAVCTWGGFWSQCPTGEEQRVATFVLRILASTELPKSATTTTTTIPSGDTTTTNINTPSSQQAQQALLYYSLVVSIVHWVASRPQYAAAIEEFVSQCSSDLRILLLGALNSLFSATSRVLHRAQNNRAAASLLPPSPLGQVSLAPKPPRPPSRSVSASSSFKREFLAGQHSQQDSPRVGATTTARAIDFGAAAINKNNNDDADIGKTQSFSLMGSLKKAASNWFSNNNNNNVTTAAVTAHGDGSHHSLRLPPGTHSAAGGGGSGDPSWSRQHHHHHHHHHESKARARLTAMMAMEKSNDRAAADVLAANTPPRLPIMQQHHQHHHHHQQQPLPLRGGVKSLFPVGVGGALADDETASQLMWEVGTSASGQVYNNKNRHGGNNSPFTASTATDYYTTNSTANSIMLLNSWTRPPPEGLRTLEDVRDELFDVESWTALVEIMLNAAASIFIGTGTNQDHLLLGPLMLEILREPEVTPTGTLKLLTNWTNSADSGGGGGGTVTSMTSKVIAQAVALCQAAAIVHVFAKGEEEGEEEEKVVDADVVDALLAALAAIVSAHAGDKKARKKAKDLASLITKQIKDQTAPPVASSSSSSFSPDCEVAAGNTNSYKGKDATAASASVVVGTDSERKSVDRTSSSLQDALQEMLDGYINEKIR